MICAFGAVIGAFFAITTLAGRSISDARSYITECFVRATDCPRTPVWIFEVRPAVLAIAMVDHNIGNWLDSTLEQNFEGSTMFRERSIAIVETKVFFWVVACAEFPRIRRRRHPDQIEMTVTNGWRHTLNDRVPVLIAVTRELHRMPVPVGFPVESLQHDPVVFESGLAPQRSAAAK
jgi:hypothetical protein